VSFSTTLQHSTSLPAPQVLTSLGVVFDFPPLPFYSSLLQNFNLISLDFLSIMPLSCSITMDYSTVLVLRTLIPAIVVSLLALLRVCHERTLSRSAKVRADGAGGGAETGGVWSFICENSSTWAFAIVFLIYPSTSSVVLSYFQARGKNRE
jgi:hypothetical protein